MRQAEDFPAQAEPPTVLGQLGEVSEPMGDRCIAVQPVEQNAHVCVPGLPVQGPVKEEVRCVERLVLLHEILLQPLNGVDFVPPDQMWLDPASREHSLDVSPLVALWHVVKYRRERVGPRASALRE